MVEPPKSIFYFYQLYQPMFDELKHSLDIPVTFIQGTPDDEQIDSIIHDQRKPALLVLDDLGLALNRSIVNIFQVSRGKTECASLIALLKLYLGWLPPRENIY